jgi:hypothetical protein
MTFPIPSLDDIEFEQLAEEARALIPRYASEWTDHNVHDPGITLLELLAWIVDQQIYQVGLVSDRYLYAFAALLGVRPKAAIPARGLIWPNKRQDNSSKQVILAEAELSRGAKVTCAKQPDIAFVLDADIHLTPANPSAGSVEASSVNRKINLTHFMQQPRSSFVFQPKSDSGNSLEIAFDQPLIRIGEYPIALGIEVDPVAVSASANKPTPWGPLFIEYRTDLMPWRQVSVVADGTFSLARTGVVLLKIPADNQANSSWLRFRLDRGFYPLPVQIVRVELNVLPIVQLEERSTHVIGRSNGFPDQVFTVELSGLPDQDIALSPMGISVIENDQSEAQPSVRFPYPLHIEVAADDHFEQWTQTGDLSISRPTEQVYRLDTKADSVVFGNGVNGKIPKNDAQIQAMAYHTTSGAEGNLASGLNWRIAGAPVQDTIFGSNPEPIKGGENAWDIDRLMAETRKRVLERHVMLSDQDLLTKINSLAGFGVARADVLLRYLPTFPDKEIRGARTVVVTPWRNSSDISGLTVDSRYLKSVEAAIQQHRVLGEKLTVITHQRVSIRIEATLLVNTGKNGENIRSEAINRLKVRLTDIAIQDANSNPWPLGRPVTIGEIKALLTTVPDVIAVSVCKLAREGGLFSEQDILLKRDEVAVGMDGDFNISIDFLNSR